MTSHSNTEVHLTALHKSLWYKNLLTQWILAICGVVGTRGNAVPPLISKYCIFIHATVLKQNCAIKELYRGYHQSIKLKWYNKRHFCYTMTLVFKRWECKHCTSSVYHWSQTPMTWLLWHIKMHVLYCMVYRATKHVNCLKERHTKGWLMNTSV